MTNKDFTYLAIVQDRSGSISSCLADQEGGLNTFIAEQRKLPGRCLVTYAQFDTRYELVFEALPIDNVGPITIVPRGSTALLDAIGRTIVTVGARLAAMPEYQRPGSVVFVVNTDGYENASREYTAETIKRLVAQQSDVYGWLFVFLSASQDAITQGAGMGFARGQTMAYDTRNTGDTYAMTSTNVGTYRMARAAGASAETATLDSAFTDEQREAATKS